MHPLANTPLDKVFPTIGCCIKACVCCTDNRKERMYNLKSILKEEKMIHEKRLEDVLKEERINFVGTGPGTYDPTTGKRTIIA